MNRKLFNLVIILLILSSAIVQAQNRVRYTAIPKEGDRFVGWMDVDSRSTTANPLVVSISPIPDSLENIPLITVSNPITSRIIRLSDNIFTSTQGVVKQEVLNDNSDNPLTTMNSSANIPALKAYFVESGNLQSDGNNLVFGDTTCNDSLVNFVFIHVQPTGSVSLLNRTFTTTYDYYMTETEITQLQWRYVMGCSNNPSNWPTSNFLPVEKVSWYAALVFCNKFSEKLGLHRVYSIRGDTNEANWGTIPTSQSSKWDSVVCNWDANGVRLPTEIEWMHAAREGVNSSYTYSGSNTPGNVAWYSANSSNITHTVAGKTANSLGLYDMSGNVCEWCWDWFSADLPNGGTNYKGPSTGTYRVRKGGWYNANVRANPNELALDRAWGIYPYEKSSENGFRVVIPNPPINLRN